jgi:hypothetical protein
MNILEKVNKETWVLCHNSIDIFHIIKLEPNGSIESGQPELEQFDTEEELEQRLTVLTGNPNYYSELKKD